MILPYTKIIGLDVIDLKNQVRAGKVREIIFSKKDFKIAGLVLESPIFSRSVSAVAVSDVLEISPQGIVVNNEDSISDLKENVRLNEAIKEGLFGIGQKVVTKSGKTLGKVNDLFISAETISVSKLFVKSTFSERVIPSTAIFEIKKRKIVVKDDFESAKVAAPAISASVI